MLGGGFASPSFTFSIDFDDLEWKPSPLTGGNFTGLPP